MNDKLIKKNSDYQLLSEKIIMMDEFAKYIMDLDLINNRFGKFKSENIILCSPYGTGKTNAIRTISEVLNFNLIRISFRDIIERIKKLGYEEIFSKEGIFDILSINENQIKSKNILVLEQQEYVLNSNNPDIDYFFKVLSDIQTRKKVGLNNTILVLQLNNFKAISSELKSNFKTFKYGCLSLDEKIRYLREVLIKDSFYSNIAREVIDIKDDVIKYVINHYTCEAGIKELEIVINELLQGLISSNIKEKKNKTSIDIEDVHRFLGPNRCYFNEEISNKVKKGVGLAWTKSGGIVLPIEIRSIPGKGKLLVSGNIGRVMIESMEVVVQYMIASSKVLDLDEKYFYKNDICINMPEIALSKDGASAALAIFINIYLYVKQKRFKEIIAFTGEIDLNGDLVRIGGLKEKFSAAVKNNIRYIFLPNAALEEYKTLPKCLTNRIEAIFVNTVEETIKILNTRNMII
ncbi:MAG: hypothetical protein E7214_06940 [Clostridium sp.]|nr:hypothetical protein [Clostridium sp.]